jgi:pimeloyl-ACP methyl ester carboxylesterase
MRLRYSALVVACIGAASAFLGAADAHAASACGNDARTESWRFAPAHGAPIRTKLRRPMRIDENTTVVIALHGMTRNADATFDAWCASIGDANAVIVTPAFTEADYPSNAFSLGNMQTKRGALVPPAEWSLQAIEGLFDAVVARTKVNAKTYTLYGHSAGAQFTHRFALMMPPGVRATRFISANAGWYTFPDDAVNFPYGLKNAPPNAVASCTAYGRKLTVLLGEEDNDPNHHQLSKSAGAMAQGPQRLAREKDAASRKCRFAWDLQTVPGAAHEQAKMAAASARLLYPAVNVQATPSATSTKDD